MLRCTLILLCFTGYSRNLVIRVNASLPGLTTIINSYHCWHLVGGSCAAGCKDAGIFLHRCAGAVAELLAKPSRYVIPTPHWTIRNFCPLKIIFVTFQWRYIQRHNFFRINYIGIREKISQDLKIMLLTKCQKV